jgi:death-on-curing protein
MTRYLSLPQVCYLHRLALEKYGGLDGIRDQGALDSAVAQPQMTFAGVELYASLVEKGAALAYSLIKNHPFNDGNKRVAFPR